MSSIWGSNVKISIFGESHGKGIGVTIDGLPSGERIDMEEIEFEMKRRRPGENSLSTGRKEKDKPDIISGMLNGFTTGTPLCTIFYNNDINPLHYDELNYIIRPGHADYTGHVRYKGFANFTGGGHFSGRLTCPLVFAGAICRQILRKRGIDIGSHISSIGEINDERFNPTKIDEKTLNKLAKCSFPTIDVGIKEEMIKKIEEVKKDNDSIGGTIECAIIGIKAGLGSPMFDGIESKISSIIFSIPGVKGIEFGNGFYSSSIRGSENNDPFFYENDKIKTRTNNHGGILGGISSGMPIIFRAGFKPTPSIGKIQSSISLKDKTQEEVNIKGRHDPCIVTRAVPVVESAAAIAMLDILLSDISQF